MRVALDVRVRQGKYSSFVRVTELLQQAAAAVDLELEMWQGGKLHADVLWNPLMDPVPVPEGVRQVLTVHDVSPLLADPRSAWSRWRRARRFRGRLKKVAVSAAAISAVSEDVASRLRVELPGLAAPVGVVPHYPAPSLRPVSMEEQERVLEPMGLKPGFVLFVAALRKHKNWEGCLRAWKTLPSELRAAHPLVFAGAKGRGEAQLQRLLRGFGEADAVHILDAVDDPKLAALYSACSVMVFPSFNEGFGLPPLEAMACGAPVIASNLTAMPEVLGDAAVLVDPWSLDDLGAAMRRLLTDSTEEHVRREASLARASGFDARRTGEAMLDLLARLGSP
ncbi:MAG: glycosyltransferase family 4 protein [Planctomycetota bacterium]|jgi:glycosyltransferase involved in cell wall biosynthesis